MVIITKEIVAMVRDIHSCYSNVAMTTITNMNVAMVTVTIVIVAMAIYIVAMVTLLWWLLHCNNCYDNAHVVNMVTYNVTFCMGYIVPRIWEVGESDWFWNLAIIHIN